MMQKYITHKFVCPSYSSRIGFFLVFFFFNVDHFKKVFIEFVTILLLLVFMFCFFGP